MENESSKLDLVLTFGSYMFNTYVLSGHELRGTHTYDMAFDEGDEIMARWPGTSLYFKVRYKLYRLRG